MGFFKDLFDLPALREEAASLREQLDRERTRHLEREERLIDQILTAAGRYGIKENVQPVAASSQNPPPPVRNQLQLAQLKAFVECAEEEGRPIQEAIALYDRFLSGGTMPFQEQQNMIEE